MLAIPGAEGEFIALVPAQPLGFRSRITLQVDDLAKTMKALKQLSLPYATGTKAYTLTDPDGNDLGLLQDR